MTARRLLPLAVVVFVNFLWAAQYPAYKVASDALPVATLNFWTFVFALIVLVPCQLAMRREPAATPGALPMAGSGSRAADISRIVVLGLLGIVPPSVFLAWGIAHSSSANASILSLTIPVLMSVLAVVMLHERLTWLRVVSLIAGLGGTLFLSAGDLRHFSLDRRVAAGNAVIFLSGLGSAFYNAYGKRLMERFSELDLLVYSEAAACVACLLVALVFERPALFGVAGYSSAVWISMAVLGVFPWGLAMVLWMYMLNKLDLSQLSVSIYLLPVFGLALSVVTVHERIGPTQIIGSALVLLGTAALTWIEEAQQKRSQAAVEALRS